MLERALSENPKYATAHAYLSEAYLRKRLTNPDVRWLNLSREAAERAVELGPDLAVAHLAFARALLEQGARPEAAESYRRAADLDPLHPMPHVGLGMLFNAARDYDNAERELSRGVALAGDSFVPRLELGQFYFTRARYDEAVTAWEDARRVTPDNVIVLRNLSAAYYFLGRYDEAASSLQRALEVRPSAAAYTNLGTIRFSRAGIPTQLRRSRRPSSSVPIATCTGRTSVTATGGHPAAERKHPPRIGARAN
jgi:tetratricopeptide (TPR) repeat protein